MLTCYTCHEVLSALGTAFAPDARRRHLFHRRSRRLAGMARPCASRRCPIGCSPVTLAMRFCLRPVLLSLLTLVAVTCSIAGPDDWPGWRGPSSNGVSTLKDLPSSWSHEIGRAHV